MNQDELAQLIGVTQQAISKYETGIREPDNATLLKLSEIFNCTTDYILGNSLKRNAVSIPVLGRIIAGIPLEAIDNIIDYEEIPLAMAKTEEFFGLKIKGNSMEPRIRENDVVIVKKQSDVESGGIAVVLINGYEATLRKVTKQENGILLTAFNSEVYQPKFYTNEEIIKLPIEILGRVVELRGKF